MYFQRKPGKKAPRVCVYYWEGNKQVPVPRKLTKHLDGKPDEMIEDWMVWYAAINSIALRAKPRDLGSEMETLLDKYTEYLKSRKKHPNTVRSTVVRVRLALPMFLDTDMDSWYLISGRLEEHLRGHINPARHNRINQSFKAFYRWLQTTHKVKHRHDLLLDNRVVEQSKTPLKFTLTPDQVLVWAKSCTSPELKFVALAGYFFSLRTGDVFGARRRDFLAGSAVEKLEDYKVLSRYGVAAKLAINITHCRDPYGKPYDPTERKRGGIVVCTHPEAARLLVDLIKVKTGYVIDTRKPEYWAKLWRKRGIPGVTIKDLRRASIYWLGHYTELPFFGLKNHARHRDPETTDLYVRRPEEAFEAELDDLDLDA